MAGALHDFERAGRLQSCGNNEPSDEIHGTHIDCVINVRASGKLDTA